MPIIVASVGSCAWKVHHSSVAGACRCSQIRHVLEVAEGVSRRERGMSRRKTDAMDTSCVVLQGLFSYVCSSALCAILPANGKFCLLPYLCHGAPLYLLCDDVPEGSQRRVVQEDEPWALGQVLLHAANLRHVGHPTHLEQSRWL